MKLRHESTTRQEEKKTPLNRKLFQMQTYEVRVPYTRSYEDPISVKKGDRVFYLGKWMIGIAISGYGPKPVTGGKDGYLRHISSSGLTGKAVIFR
jgi:hypothetical protein